MDEFEAKILALCRARGPQRTICPSEVARALRGEHGDWRGAMDEVRQAARRLSDQGLIRVSQKGCEVDALTARGAIRLGLRGG